MEKYAVALQKQGIYAPTKVGDFWFDPTYERHIWFGKTASNMEELAEQVNGAMKSLVAWADPFLSFEAILVETSELVPEPSSENLMPAPRRKLQVLGKQSVAGELAVGQINHEEITA